MFDGSFQLIAFTITGNPFFDQFFSLVFTFGLFGWFMAAIINLFRRY